MASVLPAETHGYETMTWTAPAEVHTVPSIDMWDTWVMGRVRIVVGCIAIVRPSLRNCTVAVDNGRSVIDPMVRPALRGYQTID